MGGKELEETKADVASVDNNVQVPTLVPSLPDDISTNASLDSLIKESVNHRKLNSRQIQLTSMAGAIGATLFVAIGSAVMSGPLAILIAFVFWATVVFGVAQCQLEIVTLFPLDGSFIRLAARMVDPALGVAVGWNHFFAQTSYVIFECTVINTLVAYWGYNESPAILISASLVFYMAINIYRADIFGEAEFWLAMGKILLAIGLIFFTFITMVGGNPQGDVFGFRYWKNPGPWAGNDAGTGLQSFLNALNVAGFCICGPVIAGEAKDPRKTVPRAFRTIMVRLLIFFIGGAICVGILVPYNEPKLSQKGGSYGGSSPYIIAMDRMGIPVLPSIVTAALLTCIISAGNSYTFNASRALHALALDGVAPKILRRTNKHGTPYLAVIVVGLLSCLSYLALGSGSATVLNWLINFCTAATMVNWTVMGITWIRFNKAMKVQGIDRTTFLPTPSRYQPWIGYWTTFWAFLMIWVQGYGVFLNGHWKIATFIFNYGIIALAGGIGLAFKIFARTPFHRAKDVDLHSDVAFFDALTEYYDNEKEGKPVKLTDKILYHLF